MGKRIAVCIGNNYAGTPYELAGCVNDAWDWTGLLAPRQYDTDVHVEATADEIREAIARAVYFLNRGDRLVVTFSGHGTWVPDVNGDEADRRDEALVGADMELVTDDELAGIFSGAASGTGILYVPDSCHSGTSTRLFDVDRWRNFDVDRWRNVTPAVPRFIPPTAFFRGLSEARAVELEAEPARSVLDPARVTTLAAAQDDELAWDAWFGERANGAFTRTAIDAWQEGISPAGWHRNIRGRLPSGEYPQTPRLESANLYRRYADAL
jgi:hypothetical protein